MNNSSQVKFKQGVHVISAAGVEWIIANEGAPKNPWLLVSPDGNKSKHVTKSKLKKYYQPVENNPQHHAV